MIVEGRGPFLSYIPASLEVFWVLLPGDRAEFGIGPGAEPELPSHYLASLRPGIGKLSFLSLSSTLQRVFFSLCFLAPDKNVFLQVKKTENWNTWESL